LVEKPENFNLPPVSAILYWKCSLPIQKEHTDGKLNT